MTDNTMVQAFEDELAKCETAANKIRFREETYKSLNELANKKGMRKRMAVKDIEEELAEQNEKAKVEMDEATAKRIALLEMQLEFLKQGLNPSPESVDARIEIVKSRPLKVTEQMANGITHNTDAIKASGVEVISQEEQELIDGLIDKAAEESEEEQVAEKVEEMPVEEPEVEAKEEVEEETAEEEPLTVTFEEYNDAQETEEPLEEEIKQDYVEVDANEDEDLKTVTGLTDEEIQSAKGDSEESKEEKEESKEEAEEKSEEKEEKIDTLEEVELLFKEAEDVKQQASDLANERKQAEEKIAKEEEKRKEAQKLKETRDKALKEALAKYKENIKKEQAKVEAERKAKEEAERKAKEIQEQTKEFEERTKATEKALEMIMAKMDVKGEEKKEKKK